MKYFRMKFGDASRAQQEVWSRQDAAGTPHTSFSMSADGADTSVWTKDPAGEALFRNVLNEQHIKYEEGNEQQVRTWLDDTFPHL